MLALESSASNTCRAPRRRRKPLWGLPGARARPEQVLLVQQARHFVHQQTAWMPTSVQEPARPAAPVLTSAAEKCRGRRSAEGSSAARFSTVIGASAL